MEVLTKVVICMKKYILAAAIMILGIQFGLPDMAVMAGELSALSENEEKTGNTDTADEVKQKESSDKPADVSHLQIPQKLQVVVDPWEMDGKGQIYSKKYVIKNTGKTEGTLTLSDLTCRTGENSGVVVKDHPQGLHEDQEKTVYMEMLFGDAEKTDRVVLSKKKSVYKVKLKPGEKLPFFFSGEVNETASESWKDGDLDVTVTYSWKPEESGEPDDGQDDGSGSAEPDSSLDEAGKPDEAGTENPGEDITEGTDDSGGTDEKKESTGESENPGESENDINIEETESSKDQTIELQEAGETELVIDSWKADGDGKISSVKYTMRNAGKAEGTLAVSEFFCRTEEESGIAVRTDQEKQDDSDAKSVYMELVTGNGERLAVPQEKGTDSPYEIRLEPGEEVTFWMEGELAGISLEDLSRGDIEVTAVCSWILEK